MVEGILHTSSRIMRSSRGDTEACCGNPGTPRRSRSVWATPETPVGLPVMSQFSLPVAGRHGLLPQGHTCQQECLQMEGRSIRQQCFPQRSLSGRDVVESVPELSLSAWNCRTQVPPPNVTCCVQISTGFSNTRGTVTVTLLWCLEDEALKFLVGNKWTPCSQSESSICPDYGIHTDINKFMKNIFSFLPFST